MDANELNASERQLWGSFPQGRTVDVLEDPAPAETTELTETGETAVRADVVAALLLGAGTDHSPPDRPA